METFRDYGIDIIHGKGEKKVHCPQCPIKKPYKSPGSARDKDLAVNVDKGTWFCHRCGWSGGLKRENEQKVVFKPVVKKSVLAKPDKFQKLYEFFDKRKIGNAVIDRNHITLENAYVPEKNKNENCIAFNYFVDDEIVNCKYRTHDKKFFQIGGATKVFYKLNDIKNQKECIITEGEIDALSFEVAGYINAVSVPDGGINPETKNINTKLDYLDNCTEYFKDMKKIYLATDNDGPGIRLREELARRLGKSRCWIVRFPSGCKDANEVLMKFSSTDLMNCVLTAEPYPVEGVHYANSRLDELKDIYENGYPNGVKSGWYNFDDHLRFFDSLLCVVTGIPSHGKSNFLDHLVIRLAIRNNWKFGFFSPENGKIEIHLQRLVEIIVGSPMLPSLNGQMSMEELDTAMAWINNNIFFIQPKDEDYTLDKILDAASYLVLKHGIKGLVIDPWNAIEHDYGKDTETEYTKKILNKLTYFERNYGLCLFLVAHPAKMRRLKESKKYEVPTLYDISGSANWYNKAEIGISVYRDFSEDFTSTKSTNVHIEKVKHKFMGHTGVVKFDFVHKSQRFAEKGSEDEGNYLEWISQGINYQYEENANKDEGVPF